MAGKDGRVDQYIAINFLHARFFQYRNHIADILALKGRIAAKTGDKIAFQCATLDVTFGLECGRKTEVRPELEQGGEGSDHLLGTGRQRHLLTVIVNLGSLCANLLHHQGKVRACGELINVLINIRGLGGERYTGSQSDDKSGKSHNLALTTRKQTVILRCMALQSKR